MKNYLNFFIVKNPDNLKDIKKFIEEGIGGFMIGKGGEIITFDQKDLEGNTKKSLKNFTSKIISIQKKLNKIPLFLAIDGEGGDYFNRLKSFTNLKNQRYYGERFERNQNIEKYKEDLSNFLKTMKSLNLNLNFAPVVDIAKRGYKGYIADEKIQVRKGEQNLTSSEILSSNRSFSDKKEVVEKLSKICVELYHKNKIIPTLKHFPSYGILNLDENPHTILPISKISKSSLLRHIEIYRKLFKNHTCAIMSGHIITDFDKLRPASLSRKNYLFMRKKLEFKGLIISDELNMGAIKNFTKNNLEKAAISAIRANDIILISHPEVFHFMKKSILDMAEEFDELKEKIELSYKKVISYKKKINLIKH